MKRLSTYFIILLPIVPAMADENLQQVAEGESGIRAKETDSQQQIAELPDSAAQTTSCLNPRFLVHVPDSYEASEKSPLLIFLHGRGERGTNLELVKKHGPPKLIEQGRQFPFVVVSPQCLTLDDGRGWWRTDDLQILLEHLKGTYKIDQERIYLTGLSMGGFASWQWVAEQPDTFAAVAPICGGANPFHAWKIAHLPIWVFHGAKDNVVPMRYSEDMVNALKKIESDVRFTVYPEANHDSWTKTYENRKLYDWFLDHTLTSTESRRQSSSLSSATAEDVRKQLHNDVEAGKVAGASHLVVHGNKTVYFEAAGVRDIESRESFQSDTILRIYSMSKPIVSVGAMTLYEQGKFRLDDPVSKYIPAFASTNVLVRNGDETKTVPAKRQITVRDVFRHTTGYSYGAGKLSQLYDAEGLRYRPPAGMLPPAMTIEAAAEALAKIPALHHPGEKFTYGFSTDLLGRLIEVWSEKPLNEFMREAVFDPLEMTATDFSVSDRDRRRLASCHTMTDGKLAILDKAETSPFANGFEFLSGGGGLLSTIEDYSKFCQMLVSGGEWNGKRILKRETVELMFTDQLNDVAGNFQFGLGFAIKKIKIGSGGTEREVMQYSWGGYASTDFRLVPEEQLYQIFMRQRIPSAHGLAGRLFRIVYQGLQPQR